MMYLMFNPIAVFVSAVVAMAVGMMWYSPFMFGTMWMKLKGFNKKDMDKMKKEMGKIYAINFVSILVQAAVLSMFLAMAKPVDVRSAIEVAFWLWIGFVSVTQLSMQLFNGKTFNATLFSIDTGYQLLSISAMAAVIAYF